MTNPTPPKPGTDVRSRRFGALLRFSIAITVVNTFGHLWFGFEQPFSQPFIALATAYGMDIFLEVLEARAQNRKLAFSGGLVPFLEFILPAHITGMAIAMLLYSGGRIAPIVLAVAIGIGSKALLRVRTGPTSSHHFMNPSNFGITCVLLMFPSVTVVPYHFTENLGSVGDAVFPCVVLCTGSFLNTKFTWRMPLVAGWIGGYIVQAVIRQFLFGTPVVASLAPMTGVAFVLYTFYMVTDPATTPTKPRNQVIFGASNAALYGVCMSSHIVFGLFFALTVLCAARGFILWNASRKLPPMPAPAPVPAAT